MQDSLFHRLIGRPARATLITILLVVNIIVAVATLISAYGGIVNPAHTVIPALLSMMLPIFLIAGIATAGLDLLVRKPLMAIIIALSWIASAPSLLSYSPMHPFSSSLSPEEEGRSFRLLTWNALHFWDFRGNVPGLTSNASIGYILDTDADIVNLQEVEAIQESPMWHITPEQVKSLKERYPYRVVNVNNELTVLSKYPVEYVDIDMPYPMGIRMALFRFDIKGDTINMFNVHLESIGLNMADKELYQGLFDKAPGSERAIRKELSDVNHQLVSKIATASKKRTEQARFIRRTIDSIGGNFIVAGDFNDIQGSYAVRTILGKGDMRDAYAKNAFGPAITYHGNRFYFRIDHVLYRGDMEARKIKRGDIPSSDHYPLTTTFLLNSNKDRHPDSETARSQDGTTDHHKNQP